MHEGLLALLLGVGSCSLATGCAGDPTPYSLPAETPRAAPAAVDMSERTEREMAPWRALWDFSDPAASEAAFRAEVAGLASTAVGDETGGEQLGSDPVGVDDALALELRTQIARARGLQRDFDGAREELARVAEAIGAAGPPRVRALLDLERGRLANSAGEPRASVAPFARAFENACASGLDYLAIDAAHMLAVVTTGPIASEWNGRALSIARTSPDPGAHGWGAVIANNEGWNRFEADEHEAALALFEQALELRRERPDQVEPIWIARWTVARVWRELDRVDEALVEQRAIAAEREAANAPDGYVYEEIGECLLLLDRVEESKPHFARAHELLSQDAWLVANEPERLERMVRLAR